MPKNPRACKMSGDEDCPWLTLMTMIEQYETLAAVPVITTGPSAKIALMHVRSLQRLSDALDLCIDHVGGWKTEMFGAWPTYDIRGKLLRKSMQLIGAAVVARKLAEHARAGNKRAARATLHGGVTNEFIRFLKDAAQDEEIVADVAFNPGGPVAEA